MSMEKKQVASFWTVLVQLKIAVTERDEQKDVAGLEEIDYLQVLRLTAKMAGRMTTTVDLVTAPGWQRAQNHPADRPVHHPQSAGTGI